MTASPRAVGSRANPLLVRLRKLAADPPAYRKLGLMLLEGEHLCTAWQAQGRPVLQVLVDQAARHAPEIAPLLDAGDVVLMAAAAMRGIGTLESPPKVAFVVAAPASETVRTGWPTLVLDRVQDPGNVGTLIRSAAAFGFTQVVALAGSAALWAPKVVRAGMGAHFSLHLVEEAPADALQALGVPLLGTSSHAAARIDAERLPWPCAWVLGHEGQGVSAEVAARCQAVLRIGQPGGEESLNVAAAGAVCLYESSRQRGQEGCTR